jgi:3-deoxy-D-manno-octulosonic-acid transferase
METELWPNLLAQAADHGVSVVLINARLSARSARQMQRLAWLARPALARLAMVCAQTPADAQRFVAVGYQGPVRVTGSLKFDLSIDAGLATLGRDWRSSWTFERVWLMASSREDEERPLFEAWARAKAAGELAPKTLLIVVPRHPERFESAVLMAQASGLVVSRRSEQVALAPETEVWVGDSLGEMAAYVAASDLALMGGSIAPLGGQNPIEICAQGRPVFFGRHMFNFHQIARMLQEVRAGFLVADHQDFIRQATRLSQDPSGQQKAAQEAQAFVLAHRGATERTLAALLEAPGY